MSDDYRTIQIHVQGNSDIAYLQCAVKLLNARLAAFSNEELDWIGKQFTAETGRRAPSREYMLQLGALMDAQLQAQRD